jgi:hypothetical protein
MHTLLLNAKVKLSLCLTKSHAIKTCSLIKFHAMKTRGGVEVQLYAFLTLAEYGGD